MPRTTTASEHRIPSIKHPYGYLRNRNGRTIMQYKTYAKVHPAYPSWPPKDQEQAVKALDRWIDRILNGMVKKRRITKTITPPVVETPIEKESKGLHKAMREFLIYKRTLTCEGTAKNYRVSLIKYFPSDLPMKADIIKQHLVEMQRRAKMEIKHKDAPSSSTDQTITTGTQHDYLRRIKHFLKWCLRKQYLTFNPLEDFDIPMKKYKTSRLVYSRWEIAIRLAWFYEERMDWLEAQFREIATMPQNPIGFDVKNLQTILKRMKHRRMILQRHPHIRDFGDFFTFMSITALRPSEIYSLTIHNILPEGINLIQGKGDKPRFLPFYDSNGVEIFPELVPLVTTLVSKAQQRKTISLWKGIRLSHTTQHWINVNERLCIPHLRMYSLRASAEDWWENELGLDLYLRCDLAGHDIAVYIKHYRPNQTPAALSRRATIRQPIQQILSTK